MRTNHRFILWPCVFWFSALALCASQSASTTLLGDIMQSVVGNDGGAYSHFRSDALRLDAHDFERLLDELAQRDSWQALVIRDALRIRRNHPLLARDFDERLKRVRNTPVQTRAGNWRYVVNGNDRFLDTPEHDALRLEAILIVDAELPDGQLGLEDQRGWAAFRLAVYVPPREMKVRIQMLRDKPEWLPYAKAVGAIYGMARSNPGSINAHVWELSDLYMALRPDNKAFPSLLRAIAEADADIALPALIAIRNYELTVERARPKVGSQFATDREIQAEIDSAESQLWTIRSHINDAQRSGEDARVAELGQRESELEMHLESLKAARGSQRLWETLTDLIDKLQHHEGR